MAKQTPPAVGASPLSDGLEDRQTMIEIGTRIKFTKTLTEPASGDHPDLLYARAGDVGEITEHGCREGYWAKTDYRPNSFGVTLNEFEVLSANLYFFPFIKNPLLTFPY